MHHLRVILVTLALPLLTCAAQAQAGLLNRSTRLPPITLSAGKPLADAPYELEAGKYYRLTIRSDGSQVSAPLEQSSPRKTQVAPSTVIAAASSQKTCEVQYQQCLKKIESGYTRNRMACEKAFRDCERRKE
jgi:hypothetical protein